MDPGSSSATHRSFPYPTPLSHHGLQGSMGFRPHLPPPPPPPHLKGEGTHKEDIRSGRRSIECVPETHGVAPALPSQTQEIRSQPLSGLGSKPKSWVRGEWVNKMAFVSQLQEQQGPLPPVVRGFLGAASEYPTHSIRQRQCGAGLPHVPLKEPASSCFLHCLEPSPHLPSACSLETWTRREGERGGS